MRLGHRSALILAVLVGALAVAAVAAIAGVGGSAPAYHSPRPDVYFNSPARQPEAVAPGVEPSALANFAIFRRPSSADDRIPATMLIRGKRVPVVPPTDTEVGANPALARHALTTADGDAIYPVAAQGGFCLESTTGIEGGCSAVAQALHGYEAGAAVCSPNLSPSQIAVYGVLPDSAIRSTVKYNDGPVRPLAVENNVYSLRVTRGAPLPTSISWSASDGAHSIVVPVPPGAGSGCLRPSPQSPPPGLRAP